MTVNYEKFFTPLKPVPVSSSFDMLPISHPVPTSHKPSRKVSSGIPLSILTFLSLLAILGVVGCTKTHYTRMRHRIEERIREEREHWEYKKEQELDEERRNNKHLVNEIEVFSDKLQSLQQEVASQEQQVDSFRVKIQVTNTRFQELEQEASAATDSLREAIQDIYRRDAIRE